MNYEGTLYGKIGKNYFPLQNTAKQFDDLVSINYDLSTKNDLQAEKIIELQKQRDELITLIQDVIDYSMDYNPVWVESAQELIKKCKP